jgi:hypothetical protein
MARARNIKPGFFLNEELVELPFATRLLFIGLWTLADREGRLEDKPKRIKMHLFPADDLDVDSALSALTGTGFLLRYSVDGDSFIQILAFAKHQNPHKDEKASLIPAPCKHGASMVQEPTEHGGNRADSLIPDPLLTNPDGLVAASPADDATAKPDCPHKQIVALYHEVLPQCPQIRDWTPARATQLRARWNEDPQRQTLAYWRQFFEYVATCDFLVGQAGKEPFFADLEWMTKAANFTKIREARYENRKRA